MGMKDFYTRSRANEGKKVPLFSPDGQLTEHWLVVRGIDSDVFRKSEAESKRKAIEIAQIKDEEERNLAIKNEQERLVACLIVSWSFEEEPTLENVMEFFREAPQVADMVDKVAVSRASFFANGPSSSTDSQSPNSD